MSYRVALAGLSLFAMFLLPLPELSAQPRTKTKEDVEVPPVRRPAPPPPATPAPPPPASSPAGPQLFDSQVLTLGFVIHSIEIERGKLAQKRAKSAEVKQFADRLVTEHTQAHKALMDLARKIKVKTEESELSKSLKAGAADKMGLLTRLTGSDFDIAFANAEVEYQNEVLTMLGRSALPAAQNAELKSATQTARTMAAADLKDAVRLQRAITGAKE